MDPSALIFRQDALLAGISEKDAHIALIEISGAKNVRAAEEAKQLRNEKDNLVKKLQQMVGFFG
jgi:hypothetical protein